MVNDLTKVQKCEYVILKEFINICEKENLRYYLTAGSLIGAIRHHGFIPWDDDVDIAMPRADYERFMLVANNYLPSNMSLVYYKTEHEDNKDIDLMLRVNDNAHRIVFNRYGKEEEMPPSIDIFVLDGMPKNKIIICLRYIYLLFFRIIYKFSMNDLVYICKKRSVIENIGISLSKKLRLGRYINTKTACEKLHNALKKNDYDNAENTIMFFADYKHLITFPKSYYAEGRTAYFEGLKVMIPKQAERILERMYGDYMELPPERERTPKHDITLLY